MQKIHRCEGVSFYAECLMYKSIVSFIHVQNTIKDHIIIPVLKVLKEG
jgi:hypothetical protein